MPELQGLDVHTVSFVDRAAVRDPTNKAEPMRFLLWKRDGQKGSEMPGIEELTAQLEKAEQERTEAQDELAKRDERIGELEAQIAKNEHEDEDEDDDDSNEVRKADLPEHVRAAIEKSENDARERIEKAESEAREARELAKAEQDRRVEKEFVAKAEQEMSGLASAPAKLGPVLKRASESLAKEDYDEVERVLKSASELISRSEMLREIGSSLGSHADGDDAYSQLQRKAEEIQKSEPKLSPEEALEKAMESDPELQRRYAAETRGTAHRA